MKVAVAVKIVAQALAAAVAKILFMCVANSARSQMAEGLARHFLDKEWVIQSAGSMATKVNPLAIKSMKEIGIDITSHASKNVGSIEPQTVEMVITLCAEEVCPTFLGKAKRLHWPFPDPAKKDITEEEQLKLFREVRDGIKEKIMELKNG